MKSSEYFDYKLPFWRDIKEEFPYPYRFKGGALSDKVDMVFMSPTHKWNKEYGKHRWASDRTAMLQVLYSYVKYLMAYPAQVGHCFDNAVPQITVTMWKKR